MTVRIDLGEAVPKRIVLCNPPSLSWHSKRGYWPIGYNWSSTVDDWHLKEWFECKQEYRIEPEMPAWGPSLDGVQLTDFIDPALYRLNGVMLFERPGHGAFFVLWGSRPSTEPQDTSTAAKDWWHVEGGFFCVVVDWAELTEDRYLFGRKLSTPFLMRKGDEEFRDTIFAKQLAKYCERYLAWPDVGLGPSDKLVLESEADDPNMRGRGRSRLMRVEATISHRAFLDIGGLVIHVDIKPESRGGFSS